MRSTRAVTIVLGALVVVAAAVVVAVLEIHHPSSSSHPKAAARTSSKPPTPVYRTPLSQLLRSTRQGCLTAFGSIAQINALTGQQFDQVEVVTPPDGKADVCTYDQKITATSSSHQLSVELYTPAVDVKGSTGDTSTQIVARRDGVILRVETIEFSPTPELKDYMIGALARIDLSA